MLIKETLSEALALGPLEELLADEKIDEIIHRSARPRRWWARAASSGARARRSRRTSVFERVVKRLIAEAGAQIDEANLIVDLRMRDGTRVTAAVSPGGVARRVPGAEEGADADAAAHRARRARRAVGGDGGLPRHVRDRAPQHPRVRRSGSGETTVVGALAAASPPGERVVSIEEVAELAIQRDEGSSSRRARAPPSRRSSSGTCSRRRCGSSRIGCSSARSAGAGAAARQRAGDVDRQWRHGRDGRRGRDRRSPGSSRSRGSPRRARCRRCAARAGRAGVRDVVHVAWWADEDVPRDGDREESSGCSEAAFGTHGAVQLRDGAFAATGTVPRFCRTRGARHPGRSGCIPVARCRPGGPARVSCLRAGGSARAPRGRAATPSGQLEQALRRGVIAGLERVARAVELRA